LLVFVRRSASLLPNRFTGTHDARMDMPWPQLFDEKTKGWRPPAGKFGIAGILAMFLIDRHGFLRTVGARENLSTMIPA
jgi:hypothetical protein